MTGGATETVSGGETRTITGGATETITGGETRTVSGGISETVDGGILLTVNGSTIRLLSGLDLRITGSGRIELVNASDIKLVTGPDVKTVSGPTIIVAPTIVYQSETYNMKTSTYELDAEVSFFSTPQKTVNVADEDWLQNSFLRWTNRRLRLIAAATDFYGFKYQACINNTQLNGWFINKAPFFLLDAPLAFELVGRKSEERGLYLGFTKLRMMHNIKLRKT